MTSRSALFHIISVGPGNPKWMTIEAVEKIRTMNVLAVPAPRNDKNSRALDIAEEYLDPGTEILYLDLPMTYDRDILESRWVDAARKIYQYISAGKTVGMLVLGDATLFGTSAYVAMALTELDSSVSFLITPGVISPTACASRLNETLVLGNETLILLPDSENEENLERAFQIGGTVVLMKLSRSLQQVIRFLENRELLQYARVVISAGTEKEEIIRDVSSLKGKDVPYMSLMIVKIPLEEKHISSKISTPGKNTASIEKRRGKIFLVGIGPGHRDHMTTRAREVIRSSDVVIGYVTYLKLITDLLEGKEVIRGGMTEEVERALKAIEIAREGKVVSLVSSGDAGVFGMAAPAYEALMETGWKPGDIPDMEVIPGITAVQAVSSLLGAPVSHDYCAISLSDLLTPWTVIEKRLSAAAESDLVCALYNPKSGRRTRHLLQAQEIFLKCRESSTPVGIVKSAYREREKIDITTLDRIQEYDIGMLSTVLIGNSSTINYHGRMITPRGYKRKYNLTTSEVHGGIPVAPVGGAWSMPKK